jgi:orotidine-5'-phosphate decarboxylase
MDPKVKRKLICALDTGDLGEAIENVTRFKDYVGAFKIGHALTLPNGLDVVEKLRDAGATRIFLDLKFHDIPNSVAIGVREAAKRGVWMLTIHLSGGPAMITAACEEAGNYDEAERPLIVGVSVLTSLGQSDLTDHLGIGRSVKDHMVALSKMGCECGLDGVVSSPLECADIRAAIGHGIIVVPGIRMPDGPKQDQVRVADAKSAIAAGANYLVIGRALHARQDPAESLRLLGIDV